MHARPIGSSVESAQLHPVMPHVPGNLEEFWQSDQTEVWKRWCMGEMGQRNMQRIYAAEVTEAVIAALLMLRPGDTQQDSTQHAWECGRSACIVPTFARSTRAFAWITAEMSA